MAPGTIARISVPQLKDFEKVSDSRTPPNGYSFVPIGDVYVTRHCRERTAAAGQTVFLVIVGDHHKIKKVGLHCPIEIAQAVLEDAAATAHARQEVVATKDSRDVERDRRLLFEIFPSIPSTDADRILKYGFEKGSGRVGRTTKLAEDLKFELAVKAHIRHNFTDYDDHWKAMKDGTQALLTKDQARARVQEPVESITASWRLHKTDHQNLVSTSVRRSTRLSTQITGAIQTMREEDRRNRKDKNNNRVRKTTASVRKAVNEQTLEAVLEGLSLDRKVKDPARKETLYLKTKSKGRGEIENKLGRQIKKLARRAEVAAKERVANGQGNTPSSGELTRLACLESLRQQVAGKGSSAPTKPVEKPITEYFPRIRDKSTSEPVNGHCNIEESNFVELAMSQMGKKRHKVKQMLKDLGDLNSDPSQKLSDKRLAAAFELNANLSDNKLSIDSITEARCSDAVKRRLERRFAKDAAKRARNQVRKNERGQSNSTFAITRSIAGSATPMDISESDQASDTGSDT